MSHESPEEIIHISPSKYIAGCAVLALIILFIGQWWIFPSWMLAMEVFATILVLFVFGSIRYRLDKNAVTYGAVLVVIATSWWPWWNQSQLRISIEEESMSALFHFIYHHFLTLKGLEHLVHADTMLFILGLTFFVAVIAQTRLLESVSFAVLDKMKGSVVPTIGILTAIVSFSSGILDGVSMIGLMIRTLVIILFLAKSEDEAVLFSVMISTIVTTVCGMWLAYGEPPNLIMKTNLHPHLDNSFFLRFCAPVAVGSYFIVFWNIRRKLKGRRVNLHQLDIMDHHTADVRYLQATRHGKVLTPIEFAEEHTKELGYHILPVLERLHKGEPLGRALVEAEVPAPLRKELLEKFVSKELAEPLDEHYSIPEHEREPESSKRKIAEALEEVRVNRVRSQMVGGLAFVPFIGFLVWHAINHEVPLFWASFAGFAVGFLGIMKNRKMRDLALREAKHEYNEYLFLFPLFLSIALLQKSGFFAVLSSALHAGVEKLGYANVAYLQFTGATFLSALLDNNVVADFASRALHGLEIGILHLFSMAQIAGYATGGCWTHIGSAQSVVAYSFIRNEISSNFTPFQWMKTMTPIIIEIFILMTAVVYLEGFLVHLGY